MWTADMTYIWTHEGWLYLAVVRDLFHREVVGGSIHPRVTADSADHGVVPQKAGAGLIHHSDRGSPYASHTFQARLEAYGIVCSMSRKGTCRDNAPTESFFNSLKNGRMSGCHAPATVRGPLRRPTCSTTSNRSTTGGGNTLRSATPRQ
ncbi:Mobile element protein [Candidatus Accumulibacter phosphatis]|uniref:Mobile element protein n=1 Tax=Candidatus Accumulibacter phosphatis TaxID=327160 RepID=A0A5S4EGF1_9PROT|nr:Mobile element protein [Candidatus Accumulibacter phosphatis]